MEQWIILQWIKHVAEIKCRGNTTSYVRATAINSRQVKRTGEYDGEIQAIEIILSSVTKDQLLAGVQNDKAEAGTLELNFVLAMVALRIRHGNRRARECEATNK